MILTIPMYLVLLFYMDHSLWFKLYKGSNIISILQRKLELCKSKLAQNNLWLIAIHRFWILNTSHYSKTEQQPHRNDNDLNYAKSLGSSLYNLQYLEPMGNAEASGLTRNPAHSCSQSFTYRTGPSCFICASTSNKTNSSRPGNWWLLYLLHDQSDIWLQQITLP